MPSIKKRGKSFRIMVSMGYDMETDTQDHHIYTA